jgi:ATP-binding cassette subfamily B (MDR/TAP) protein 1
MRRGRIVEEGTHRELVSKEYGAYRNLVQAQQLAMGEATHESTSPDDSSLESFDTVTLVPSLTAEDMPSKAKELEYKPKWVIQSLGLLFFGGMKFEYARYGLMVAGCLVASGKLIICFLCYKHTNTTVLAGAPLQAYLFAKLITVFQYTGEQLSIKTAHLALMFFVLAIGVGYGYFALGWSSNKVSVVSPVHQATYHHVLLS